jgi:tetratricopeptide (TPR) repeat protein
MKKIAFFLIVLFMSCRYRELQNPFSEVERSVKLANDKGLLLPNPFEIDEAIQKDVLKAVNNEDPPYMRLRKALRYLHDNGFLNFEYDMSATLTAQEAFEKKRGNCLSHTGLFIALCRHLDVPVYFVYVSEALDFEERDGSYVVSSHIATGFADGSKTTVVDFNSERDNFRIYEKIDDRSAYCLFYNNLAVDKLMQGDYAGAEKILVFLLDLRPDLKEVQNNMGVLLMKTGRYEEALQLYLGMRASSQNYQPALHNGLLVAKRLQQKSAEDFFAADLREISDKDPLLLYQKGIELEKTGNFSDAAACLRKALGYQPRNAFLYAVLARVYIENKDEPKAKAAYQRAKTLAPRLSILDELVKDYPKFLIPQ